MSVYSVVDKVPNSYKKEFGTFPEPVIKFLLNRNIRNKQEYDKTYGVHSLEDPFSIGDIKFAIKRLLTWIKNNKYIVIYGDYDADGIISAYILYDFFQKVLHYSKVSVWLPNRFTDGYGLNEASLKKISLIADSVITVDCGIRDKQLINQFSKALDFIVIDHHELPDDIPNVPIVHPQHPKGFNLNKVTSAGITTLKFISAFSKIWLETHSTKDRHKFYFKDNHLYDYLDVASITIATDVMPVIGENRLIVKLALEKIRKQPNKNLQQFLNFVNRPKEYINFSDFGFVLGPRLNATGRLYDPNLALDFLLNPIDLKFSIMDKINTERRNSLDLSSLDFELFYKTKNNILIVFNNNFSEGLIGLVAARLVQEFHIPAIVMTVSDNGEVKGSARSIDSFHITEFFNDIADAFSKYGGHASAAGFTLTISIEDFIKRVEDATLNVTPQLSMMVDDVLDVAQLDFNLMQAIKEFEPFGPANSQFKLIVHARVIKVLLTDKGKVKIILEGLSSNKRLDAYLTYDTYKEKFFSYLQPGRVYYFKIKTFGDSIDLPKLWIEDRVDTINFIEI